MDEKEVDQLFKVLRKLRDDGLAILFITHFLDQTYQISDRITILKNGTSIDTTQKISAGQMGVYYTMAYQKGDAITFTVNSGTLYIRRTY